MDIKSKHFISFMAIQIATFALVLLVQMRSTGRFIVECLGFLVVGSLVGFYVALLLREHRRVRLSRLTMTSTAVFFLASISWFVLMWAIAVIAESDAVLLMGLVFAPALGLFSAALWVAFGLR